MRHVSNTYRFPAALVSLGILLSIALPAPSQAFAPNGSEAPSRHVTTYVDACDHQTMPRDMQCGCCTVEAPMPEVPETLLQNSTFKHLTSSPPAAQLDVASPFEDAGAGKVAFSGVPTSFSVRLHVLHATFLN